MLALAGKGGGRDRVNIKSIIMQLCNIFKYNGTLAKPVYGDDGPHLKTLKEKFDIDVLHVLKLNH